jgi:sugar O-acyltransferase (sialic acid O-acetyltransferase NeuD family)
MTRAVVLVGVGGHGRECLDVLEASIVGGESIEMLGFVDDAPAEENLRRVRDLGYRYLGTTEVLREHPAAGVVIGIGVPRVRALVDERLAAAGLGSPRAAVVHPQSSVGRDVRLAEGVVVFAGVRLSTDITVGRHTHLHPNVTIGHDSELAEFVSVYPLAAVSGDCVIEAGATIGAGAVVLPGRRVGRGAYVGAGACVVDDVPPGTTVKGVPAR